MFRHVLVGIGWMGVAAAASAEPLTLSDQQLDTVSGGVIVAANFERIVQNGAPGFVVTLTDLDEKTGQVSTRMFGRTFTIPTSASIAFAIGIGARR
jgi:hypothetical protein